MSAATIAFTFDPVAHEYRDEAGALVTSVTQLLKEAGLYNFDHVPQEILALKAHLGRLVHKACWLHDENDLPDELPEEVIPYLNSYKSFRRETGYAPTINEFQKIACVNGMKYGMQLDSVGTCNGQPWLVDLKTSESVMPYWGPQTAAYDLGYPLAMKRKRVIVQLSPTGYRLRPFTDPADYHIFQSALALSVWKRNNKIA